MDGSLRALKGVLLLMFLFTARVLHGQSVALEVPHAFYGTHFKTFKEQGEYVRTWYEVSGRYSRRLYGGHTANLSAQSRIKPLRILDTYGDEGYTAVKIESRGWIYILIQSNAGISESKIQARQKEPRD